MNAQRLTFYVFGAATASAWWAAVMFRGNGLEMLPAVWLTAGSFVCLILAVIKNWDCK